MNNIYFVTSNTGVEYLAFLSQREKNGELWTFKYEENMVWVLGEMIFSPRWKSVEFWPSISFPSVEYVSSVWPEFTLTAAWSWLQPRCSEFRPDCKQKAHGVFVRGCMHIKVLVAWPWCRGNQLHVIKYGQQMASASYYMHLHTLIINYWSHGSIRTHQSRAIWPVHKGQITIGP
jgi:hypothetical protein